MHAFGTLSQILGVRLRSWRGIFSYSNNYKLDIVGRHGQVPERLHLSSTSHCAMALESCLAHTTTSRTTIVCNMISLTNIFGVTEEQTVSQSNRIISRAFCCGSNRAAC